MKGAKAPELRVWLGLGLAVVALFAVGVVVGGLVAHVPDAVVAQDGSDDEDSQDPGNLDDGGSGGGGGSGVSNCPNDACVFKRRRWWFDFRGCLDVPLSETLCDKLEGSDRCATWKCPAG